MTVLVVTGTGPRVGATTVTAAVAALARDRGSSVAVVKVAQTGASATAAGDLDEVRRLAAGTEVHELSRYRPAAAPLTAARLAGLPPLEHDPTAATIRGLAGTRDLVLIDGTGGLLVRLGEGGWTLAELARRVGGEVLVVTAAGAAGLGHTALTLEVLAGRGLRPGGVVVGAWPAAPGAVERAGIADLETLAGRPLGGVLADGAPHRPDFLGSARHGLGPEYGGRFAAADFRRLLAPDQNHDG